MVWKLREDRLLDEFRETMKVHPFAPVYTTQLLSPNEADGVFRYLTGGEWKKHKSTVYNTDGTSREDTYFRDCSSYDYEAIKPYAKMLRTRVNEMVQVAADYYGFPPINELIPLDPFQVLEYTHEGKFRAHADSHMYDAGQDRWVPANKGRKLSFVMSLSNQVDDPQTLNEFSGGSLNFTNIIDDNGEIFSMKPKAGLAVVFPSNPLCMHEVVPVIKGRRISIVNWFDYR